VRTFYPNLPSAAAADADWSHGHGVFRIKPMSPIAAWNTRASPRAKTRDSRTTQAPDSA
jgi:hypothetical protein